MHQVAQTRTKKSLVKLKKKIAKLSKIKLNRIKCEVLYSYQKFI